MPSKEEIRQNVVEWIEALRSGNYEQGHGVLHEGNAYCCLGVGVESLYGNAIWEVEDDTAYGYYYRDEGRNIYSEVLSQKDREALGLILEDQDYLAHMNDYECLPFDYIADWIEKNVLARLGE